MQTIMTSLPLHSLSQRLLSILSILSIMGILTIPRYILSNAGRSAGAMRRQVGFIVESSTLSTSPSASMMNSMTPTHSTTRSALTVALTEYGGIHQAKDVSRRREAPVLKQPIRNATELVPSKANTSSPPLRIVIPSRARQSPYWPYLRFYCYTRWRAGTSSSASSSSSSLE